MNTITHSSAPVGVLWVKHIKTKKAPLAWRLRNALRWNYVWGLITVGLAKAFSAITGIPTIVSSLRLVLTHNGERIDYGIVGRRVVSTAGVGYLVDAWQNSVELENMKYHAVGTGTTAEATSDTALGTESTTAGAIDASTCTGGAYRPAGTTAEGASANIFSSAATVGFDGSAAITEHGLFSASSSGVLWDRTVFAAVNVVNTDTLAFTYQVTFPAGS